MRVAMLVGLLIAAGAGAARAQGWSEPDPAALVGRWSGAVAWKQCAAVGGARIALDVVRDGSGYRIDLAPMLEGLKVETFAPVGGSNVEASRDDLHAIWTAGKLDRATLKVELGGGCQATAALRRDSLGVAGCDELIGLRAVAAACPALATIPPRRADAVLATLRIGRRVAARARATADATCRTEARPLRAALMDVGCVPEPVDPHAGPPVPECDALIATVVRATRCDRVPVDMKQRLSEQIRIVARSAAVAEPEARALLIESCRLTQVEIIETLKLVGCAP